MFIAFISEILKKMLSPKASLLEDLPKEKPTESFHEQLELRIAKNSPYIHDLFLKFTKEDSQVCEIGELIWWPSLQKDLVLAGVKLTNGKFILLGYDSKKVQPIILENRKAQLVLDNLAKIPEIKLDDDGLSLGVYLYFTKSRSVILSYDSLKNNWKFDGENWRGDEALKKLEEHSISTSFERS